MTCTYLLLLVFFLCFCASPIYSSSVCEHNEEVINEKKALTLSKMNKNIKNMQYAVRGELVLKALALEAKLKGGDATLPFDEIIYSNIGNPQSLGQRPISFLSQVLALVNYPAIMDEDPELVNAVFPSDAQARAKLLLSNMKGGPGAYSHSKGVPFIRQSVADFIERRDGFPANPEHIFLTDGASAGIKNVINMLIDDENDGIMTPIPQYPLYSASISGAGGKLVSYYLQEEDGWSLDIDQVRLSYLHAVNEGIRVRGMVIINPGNPTGQVLSVANVREVLAFCAEHNIVLLADEVYQVNVYNDERPFVSFKSVQSTMALEEQAQAAKPDGKCIDHQSVSNVELFSFHSTSKGLFGECGRRGGYFEAVNIHPDITDQLYKLASVSLCSNTMGQITVDVMVNPPREGDASYPQYKQETDAIYNSLKRRASKLVAALNTLEGVSCQPSEGALYAFPRVEIPKRGIEAAAAANKAPDTFYALSLLESTGVCVVPGSGFKDEHSDSYHFRTTFLPAEEKMDGVIERVRNFHQSFISKYGDPVHDEL